jgi:hypothetical protein
MVTPRMQIATLLAALLLFSALIEPLLVGAISITLLVALVIYESTVRRQHSHH